jgi:hypothetical protein
MSEAHCNSIPKRKALGLVTHDNTGGPFVVECQGCGEVYPSFHCLGGGQIADTGDYDDARCPHCDQVDPEECDNAALAWNTQQVKINALQELLNQRDEANHDLEQRRHAEQQACQAAERRVEDLLEIARSLTIQAHAAVGNTEHHEDCIRDLAALNPTAEAASHEE